MQGGHREEGLNRQTTGSSVWGLYHRFGLQTLVWLRLLVLKGKKLAFNLITYLNVGPSPPISTSRPHVINAPRPSLLFRWSHVLLRMQTEGKNGGGLGTRLLLTHVHKLFCFLHMLVWIQRELTSVYGYILGCVQLLTDWVEDAWPCYSYSLSLSGLCRS